MDTQILLINSGCNGQMIKQVHDAFVHFLIVVSEDLVPEVEHLGHISGFVIAPQEEHIMRIS